MAADRHLLRQDHVDKILKGANPADLPIEQPIEFDLVIKRRPAAIGVTLPRSLRLRVDQVIEERRNASGRGHDVQVGALGGGAEPAIVGHQAGQVFADGQRGGEVDGVERTERRRIQRCRGR